MTQGLSFWWHWYVHWHKFLLLRDELKILKKLQAFAGNPLCGAICTNCFEKCTYFSANIKDDSRNAPKLLRKTVSKTKYNPYIYYLLYINKNLSRLLITQLLSQCFKVFLSVIFTVFIFTEHQYLCEKCVTVHKEVFQRFSILVFIWSVS